MASAAALMYQQRAAQLRTQLVGQTLALYKSLPNWDDPDALAVPAARMSVQAQTIQARLIQSLCSAKAGERITLDLESVVGDAIRNGDITEAWRIPMYSLWGALSDGAMSQDEIVQWGSDLVGTQSLTDLSFSQREAMDQVVSDSSNRFIGYYRVPSPGSSCEFCVLISDALYHSEDLMPVHPGCTCSVEPAMPEDV